jgi:inosine-uridine nucleoside N-ribohydrolase
MKRQSCWLLAVLLLALPVRAQKTADQPSQPVAVIFDSDMGPDYDDVGAIALLHAFADSGYATILATVASTKYEGVAAVFNVFNTYFKRPEVPIGVPRGKALEFKDRQHWTDSVLLHYPHHIKKNADVPSACDVYRKVLAHQPDHSVTIITVGFLTNIADLLQTLPDQYSDLTGKQLVKQKVKQLVCMGGRFPQGSEFNIDRDPVASRFVFENLEIPVLFSGVEIGFRIKTGLPLVHNDKIRNSPVKDVFRICIPLDPQDKDGRPSWDETAVLVAIKGYRPWYTIKSGTMIVHEKGNNTWSDKSWMHSYLVEEQSPDIVRDIIDRLMQHQP